MNHHYHQATIAVVNGDIIRNRPGLPDHYTTIIVSFGDGIDEQEKAALDAHADELVIESPTELREDCPQPIVEESVITVRPCRVARRRAELRLTANGDPHGNDQAIERMDVGGGVPGRRDLRAGGRTHICVVEGEATVETNFPTRSDSRPTRFANIRNEVLSEGDWLTNGEDRAPGEAEPFAQYRVTVPADGTYQLYTRKFWKHGPFRWRFGADAWQTCGGDVALLDSTPIRQFLEANWVRLGEVKLQAGDQTFELRLLAKEGQSKGAAFDAFVLMQSPFVPRGKLKPDSKSGQATEGFWAFEPDAEHVRA